MAETENKPRRRAKKAKHHEAHHGGAWKVAYADFVTAMMALFLVLWLVSQADQKVKSAIANYFRSPGVFDTMKGGIIASAKKVSKEPGSLTSKDEEQALSSVAETLRKQFSTRTEFAASKDQIKIDITDEGLRIQIVDKAERVSFGSGSATLTSEARLILNEISRGICELPNPILVGGHTDRHLFPPGSVYTNWELSTDRANAARRELEAGCVKPELIRRIVGYADTQLLVPEDPYATANRRISITVLRLNNDEPKEGASETSPNQAETPATKDSAAENRKSPASTPASTKDTPAHTDVNKPSTHADAPHAEVKADSEARRAESQLATQGSISVGAPDAVPANATRTRERAPSRLSVLPQH